MDSFRHDERVIESFLTGMVEGVVLWSSSHEVTGCNPAAERLFGRSRRELVGRRPLELELDLVDREGRSLERAHLPAAYTLATGNATESVIGIRRADGQRIWLRESSQPLRDDARTVSGAISTFVDVTEAHETVRRLTDVVTGANMGTWELDTRSGHSERSDRWFELVGHRRADVAPTFEGLRDLVHAEDRAAFERIPSYWSSGSPFRVELRLRRGNGEWGWYQIRGMPHLGPLREPERVSGVLVDIDERKRAELSLRSTLEENVRLVAELRAANAKLRELEGLLSICVYCKAIRDEATWVRVESFISQRSRARFSHGICPDCYAEHHPEDEPEVP